MVSSPVRVDAPPVVPARGGLLHVASIVEASDPHTGMGVEYYTFLCGSAGIAPGLCEVAPGVTVDAEKHFSGGQTVTGGPFAVYAGIECDLFGAPYDAQARARLSGGEERAVARAFYESVFTAFDTDVHDLGEVGSLADLIGQLEQYAGENYAGEPILHMNRRTAAAGFAASVLFPGLDGSVTTGQGTLVANSPGYPDGVVFVTGQVNLWRTSVEVHDVPDPRNNKALALAERIYVAATDCLLAVGTFDPDAPGGGGTGPVGPPGPAGPSAYEVAVEHGFEGTEEEWLASLRANVDDKADRLGDLTGVWLGTQAEYDAITDPDPTVVYAVVQD